MTVLRLRFWENEEEYGKFETWVFSKTGPINFKQERFAQIQPVLRETQGSLSMIFIDLLLQSSSKSQLQSQIRLALVERLLKMYFMDEYYLFSFIFNKLMIIMHNFINDGLLIYFVTTLTILAS